MPRQVSATALAAMMAESTDQVFLTLVEIAHPGISAPLRFVNDTRPLTHGGQSYEPAGFTFRLPEDVEDNVPAGQIVLDNTDRRIIQAVRGLNTAPLITVKIVLADSPDTIELGPMNFALRQFSYDAGTVTGRLSYDEDFLNEGFPKYNLNPRTAAGLF